MPTVQWNKRWAQDFETVKHSNKFRYYGMQWGDPSRKGISNWFLTLIGKRKDLSKVITQYITPYIKKETVLLEIGVGGGRWTQFMLGAKELILVDLNAEFFPYVKQRFPAAASKMQFYETKGYELDGVENDYVDFVFSYGTFVHIDPDGIDKYLGHIKRIMQPGAIGVIHYADRTKKFFEGRKGLEQDEGNPQGFSDMSPQKMEGFLSKYGYRLLEHNRSLLRHSNIVVFQKQQSNS